MKDSLFSSISLSSESLGRLGFFLKIEELQVNLLLAAIERIAPNDFVDVGANVGFYSLLVNKYFAHINIAAFEPTPSTFDHLSRNLGGASETIQLYQLALTDRRGDVEYADFGLLSGKNGIRQTLIHGHGQAEKIVVKTDTLDRVLPWRNKTVVMKIDAEGGEVGILRGGVEFFLTNRLFIQVEVGHGGSDDRISKFFKDNGFFSVFDVGPDRYYSNMKDYQKPENKLALLSAAINSVVFQRWGNPPSWKS